MEGAARIGEKAEGNKRATKPPMVSITIRLISIVDRREPLMLRLAYELTGAEPKAAVFHTTTSAVKLDDDSLHLVHQRSSVLHVQ